MNSKRGLGCQKGIWDLGNLRVHIELQREGIVLRIEHILPEELKELLKESLRVDPRPFLFIKGRVSNKDPISPMSPSEYSSWANRILTRIFNKPTNLTALRHSYVHTIDYNKPLSELKKITDAMGHSVSMSMGYKLNKEKK